MAITKNVIVTFLIMVGCTVLAHAEDKPISMLTKADLQPNADLLPSVWKPIQTPTIVDLHAYDDVYHFFVRDNFDPIVAKVNVTSPTALGKK